MSMNDLFYILQETDLNNQELYLPPDTPFGKTNTKRLKALMKKRHARQRERLLNQQVAELEDYQKYFAKKNKGDIFVTPTETACELMSGPDFLIERNDQIMELLSMIPLMDKNTEKDTAMAELTDPIVPEEKTLAPPPPPASPSEDEMDTSEDEEDSLNDMPQDGGGGGGGGGKAGIDDEAINERKMKYSTIIKEKYRKGFTRLRRRHEAQLKRLQDLQREDLDVIKEEAPSPVPLEVTEAGINPSPARSNKEHSPRPNEKGKQRQSETGRATKEQQREASSTALQTTQQLPKTMHRNNERSNTNKSRQTTDKNMPWSQHPQPQSYTSKIPDVATALKPPTVPLLRPPISAGPPSVATAGSSPVVPPRSRNNNSSRGGTFRKERRDSNQPLFDTKPFVYKPSPLLADTSGSIYIKNNPDRVIINGQEFGSPKDFDDAINGIHRQDNSIFKRHLNGDVYLYFKSSTGKLVTLGKVSRIQPFIHKFLLSK